MEFVAKLLRSQGINTLLWQSIMVPSVSVQALPKTVSLISKDTTNSVVPEQVQTIVVTGSSQRGNVVGDIAPEFQLERQDIQAIGAGSIAELLTELAPLTNSGRSRGSEAPVVLINGKRVSGYAEIRNIPTDVVQRVDILPEEVALKYGYRANQRVVNFVLNERFRAVTSELSIGGPTAGGRRSDGLEATLLQIQNGKRLSLAATYNRDTMLLESQRFLVSTPQTWPFDLVGNVSAPISGTEIDPAPSALTGQVATIAGVTPSGAMSAPSLATFTGNVNPGEFSLFRSLLPSSRKLSISGAYTGSIGYTAMTITAGLESSSNQSQLGLASATLLLPPGNSLSPFSNDVNLYRDAPRSLFRASESWNSRFGTVLNGRFGIWFWSLTANYAHTETYTRSDRRLALLNIQQGLLVRDPKPHPFGLDKFDETLIQDHAISRSDTANGELVSNGALFALPAGDLAATLKVGVQKWRLSNQWRQTGIEQDSALLRSVGNFQASFDIPISNVRNRILPSVGDLTVNWNIAIDHFSDFGTLSTFGYGLIWKPAAGISLIASVTHEEDAPSIQQLGDPVLTTPNVQVFDFMTGTTAEIRRIDGGNPVLAGDRRRVLKFGVTLKPFYDKDLVLQVNYNESRIDDPIASFPIATAELEAAFPDRFLRNAQGQLLQIDNRPINFARSERQQLRWGFNFSKRLKLLKAEHESVVSRVESNALSTTNEAGQSAVAVRSSAAGGPRIGGTPEGSPSSGASEGRLQLSAFHTLHVREAIIIRDGIPVLDLLNGSALSSRGGQPRHEIEIRAGITEGGFGARLSANWQSGTRILFNPRNAATEPEDLFFSVFATINLRLFAHLGQRSEMVGRMTFLRGSRISLTIDNVTNSRIVVRDRNGQLSSRDQYSLSDPLGRTIRLSFRKQFY